jgi:hypothetical protein
MDNLSQTTSQPPNPSELTSEITNKNTNKNKRSSLIFPNISESMVVCPKCQSVFWSENQCEACGFQKISSNFVHLWDLITELDESLSWYQKTFPFLVGRKTKKNWEIRLSRFAFSLIADLAHKNKSPKKGAQKILEWQELIRFFKNHHLNFDLLTTQFHRHFDQDLELNMVNILLTSIQEAKRQSLSENNFANLWHQNKLLIRVVIYSLLAWAAMNLSFYFY